MFGEGFFFKKKQTTNTESNDNQPQQTSTNLFQSLNVKPKNALTNNSNDNNNSDINENNIEENDAIKKKRTIKKIKNNINRPGRPRDINNNNSDDEDVSNNKIEILPSDVNNIEESRLSNDLHIQQPTNQINEINITTIINNENIQANNIDEEEIKKEDNVNLPVQIDVDSNNNDNKVIDVENDIQLKITDDIDSTNKKIIEYRDKKNIFKYSLESIKDTCRKMFSERKIINEQLFQSTLTVKELEEEQEKAVEEDDFEKAQQLDENILELKENDRLLRKKLVDMFKVQLDIANGESIDDLTKRFDSEMKSIIDDFIDVHEKHTKLVDEYNEHVANELSNLLDDISIKEELVSREESHLQLDQELLDKSIQSLSELVANATQPLTSQKKELIDRRTEKQNEIEELLKLLEEKKREQQELDEQINDIDSKIVQSRLKFHKEDSRINQKKEDLDTQKQSVDKIKKELQDIKDEYETKKNPKDHESFQMISQINELLDENKSFNQEVLDTIETIKEQQIIINSIYSDIVQHINSIESITKKTSSIKLNIESLQSTIITRQKDIVLLKNSINVILETIPQLEQSKQMAKEAKKFSEAGSILNEIKQQQQLVIEKKQTLSELQEELEVDTKLVNSLEDELKTFELELKDHETKSYKSLLQHLEERFQILETAQLDEFHKSEFDWIQNEIQYINKLLI